MSQDLVIYDPVERPFRGLRTGLEDSSVPLGFFTQAQNVRTDKGTISVRGGQALLAADGLDPDGVCVGATLTKEGANTFYYVALQFSPTDVRIYGGVHNGTSWHTSLLELTATSGQFGNTRMSAPSSGQVTFTTVYEGGSGFWVLAQNGKDAPRALNGSLTPLAAARRVEAIPPPQSLAASSPQFGVADNLDTTGTNLITTTVGNEIRVQQTGTPLRWQFFTTATAIAIGDKAEISSTTDTLDCSASDQLFVVAQASTDAFFTNCKWEIKRSSGANLVIHDPDNGIDSVSSVETNIPGFRVYAFPLQHLAGETLSAVTGLALTCLNPRVEASQTLDIYTVAAGGRVPGLAEYTVCWANSFTGTESPGVTMRNRDLSIGVSGIWGSVNSPLPHGFQLPVSPALRYRVLVPTMRPASADRDKGVDYVKIYRRDPGEDEAFYIGQEQTSVYSLSWAYTANYSAALYMWPDTVPEWGKNTTDIAPDAFNEPVPIGQAALWAGGRHYVGTYLSDPLDAKGVVKVSDTERPFRFRSIARSVTDARGGYSARLDGEESVEGFVSAAASVIGGASVYCFSSEAVYLFGVNTIRRAASIGLGAPHSVADHQGRVFWIDPDRSARRMAGQIDDISRLRVDGTLTGAGNLSAIDGAFWRDRWYLAYTDGGTRKVLVWSELLGDWESIDTPAIAPSVWLPWRRDGSTALLFAAPNGSLYQYEAGATDAGTEIAFLLKTGEVHSPRWERVTVGPSAIVASDKDSETATFTYASKVPVQTATGTTGLGAAGAETSIWKMDKTAAGGSPEVKGAAASVSMAATIAGPFSLFAWKVKSNARAGIGQSS